MIQDWIFYATAGLLLITMILLWSSMKKISNLEEAVRYLTDSRNAMRKDIDDNYKKIIRFGKQIEEHQETMQVYSSTLSGAISNLEKRVDILEQPPVEEEKAESDEDECNDPPASEVEFWASNAYLADIVEPENPEKSDEEPAFEWSHEGDEIIGYRWMFPSREQCVPVYGQRYMVVGILHNNETMYDGSPFICTVEATWDQYKFVIDGGERFDKVYAYIKIPNSSDIIKSILDIAISDREG